MTKNSNQGVGVRGEIATRKTFLLTAPLFFTFLTSNFSALFVLLYFIAWSGSFKKSFRKKKNIRKTTQTALAPSIFIVLSIALKLGTPLPHTHAQNKCYRIFNFALEVEIWTKNLQKTLFYPTGSALTKHNFFRRSNPGQQLFGRSSSEQSDHGSSMPAPCGAGEIPASWLNCKNCSAAGTRLYYLNCNSDSTITHWCCSSRSSRTWPLLIWQSFCQNSLPVVVIIFEKICILSLL